VISTSLVAALLVTELPYQTAPAMLSGTLATVSTVDQAGFLNGIQKALLVSAVLSLIGMIPSAMGGSEKSEVSEGSQPNSRVTRFRLLAGFLPYQKV
jgi:hypothetical protein